MLLRFRTKLVLFVLAVLDRAIARMRPSRRVGPLLQAEKQNLNLTHKRAALLGT